MKRYWWLLLLLFLLLYLAAAVWVSAQPVALPPRPTITPAPTGPPPYPPVILPGIWR
jgi:hypothetical protein